MVNTFTEGFFDEFTIENLLDYNELRKDKTILRKAFSMMLNHVDPDQETGNAQMVLDTARIILEDLNLGAESVQCLMLKNMADKGVLSPVTIEAEFGTPVLKLIEGIHKIEHVDTKKYNTNRENFIGLLLTLSPDIRVLLIRLGMLLYDMRHISRYSLDKQCLIAGETKALYIPIAHRLGLYRIKNELEDRVMRFNDPRTYEHIKLQSVSIQVFRIQLRL